MRQKVSIPLLRDHHNHPSIYAPFFDCLNLQEIEDKAEAVKKLKALDKEKVSVVLGWNSRFYQFSEADLRCFPPVIIVHVSLHSFIMNTSAETMLKEKYPDIVANYKDASWYEEHFPGLLVFLAGLVDLSEQQIKTFFDHLYEKGVYYMEEMHLPSENVYSIIRSSPYAERTAFWTDLETFKTLGVETQNSIEGIKLFTDGALGARTAAMSQPYKNGKKGSLLFSDEALYRIMHEVIVLGKAAAVHAIGDLATSQVVRTVGKLKENGFTFPKIRMEHCQFIDKTTAREAKELGIIFSMQPNFSTDSTVYSDRLLPQYLEQNNPFRMLIDKAGIVPGEDLILGSDGMPQGAEAALQASLFPPFPQQKLTLNEFIAAYCMPDKSYGEINLEIEKNSVKII
jgi:predicted amidohydrolase YtcJ